MSIDDELKNRYSYDPLTGIITNKKTGHQYINNHNNYVQLRYKQKTIFAHRLAWLLHYGTWPIGCIDHINRIRNDNRICNLRDCTQQQNSFNKGRRCTNKSGHIGVSWSKYHNKWEACIMINAKKKHLGLYKDIDAASEAYKSAAKLLHGEFLNANIS